MKSSSIHDFGLAPQVKTPRSVFNRSHSLKTTFYSDVLVPIFVDEALPGDTFKLKANLFARMATPITPVMDNLWLDTFYFAVPNRLLWEHWKNFMGEKATTTDETEYIIPVLDWESTQDTITVGSTLDHMGFPLGTLNANSNYSALFARAYGMIWNEWFRDQNLQDPVTVPLDDGPDDVANVFTPLPRGKRHDYFTSCLLWPQKGDDVLLPLGDTAPVYGNGKSIRLNSGGAKDQTLYNLSTGEVKIIDVDDPVWPDLGTWGFSASGPTDYGKAIGFNISPDATNLYADLENATASTINSLREAFALQRLMERDARGGTRYTEIIQAHFGVISPDGRMQRPEYLGGSSQRITLNPVTQTSSTTGNYKTGDVVVQGYIADTNGFFTKSFTEHCIIIGLACVRGDQSYSRGCPRMFTRSSKYDFYWPALAHLGEQEVLTREIWEPITATTPAKVFGYQERFAEYRYKPSEIHSYFRSDAAGSLDTWHLAEKLTSEPILDEDFIKAATPVGRIIGNENVESQFLMDGYFELHCARPMPVYSVPGLIDHF